MKKKGVSPVITTVLLILIVLIIALIVFLWLRSFIQEPITKFGGKNVELVCADIVFQASYSGDELHISNTGNIPLYDFQIQLFGDGEKSTILLKEKANSDENCEDDDCFPEIGLNPGAVYSQSIQFGDYEKIIISPVLWGTSDSGRKDYVCDEKYGKEILI